jgi:hypothetical protein
MTNTDLRGQVRHLYSHVRRQKDMNTHWDAERTLRPCISSSSDCEYIPSSAPHTQPHCNPTALKSSHDETWCRMYWRLEMCRTAYHSHNRYNWAHAKYMVSCIVEWSRTMLFDAHHYTSKWHGTAAVVFILKPSNFFRGHTQGPLGSAHHDQLHHRWLYSLHHMDRYSGATLPVL